MMYTKGEAEVKTINAHIDQINDATNIIDLQLIGAGFIIENPSVERRLRKALKHLGKAIADLNEIRKDFI